MTFVMTVKGPIKPEALGHTLIHEHLHMDVTRLLEEHGYKPSNSDEFDCCVAAEARWNPGFNIQNYQLTDDELIIDELSDFIDCGGRAIVDATPRDLGRDPLALKHISEKTGLHIVMGTGYYLEATHKYEISGWTGKTIADSLICEIENGVDDTGIKPGLIGEIGTNSPVTESELEVLRAAAWANKQTGLSVSVHLHPWGWEGRRVTEVLLLEGVEPDRILLNHLNTAITDDTYQRDLLNQGVYLAYDLMGFDHSLLGFGRYPPSDDAVCDKIVSLVRAGYLDQILLSHDIGVRTRLRKYGGWGYSHVHRHIVPLLISKGLVESDINVLLEQNPLRVLKIDSSGVV